ncbi:hypothetical protein JX265_006132 [Neoarthrinium moseri]|uniref:SMP-30/Gluconolactonase/LRE-like region domain-containing protein n=1 Tax=Neoarthrinium moseri TaxID=1658444 RepID=A0A9P9WNA6_9PEZI|nr:hypothetical protein JX266_013120 [Neoarthrinium moseri]KAI1871092.1 hypothetical protein JX265_006132 [Neoarthrinium moseri]
MRASHFIRGLYSATAALAMPSHARQGSSLPLPAKTIFQFPSPGHWAENIAVRENGNLLVTLLLPAAELWEIAAPYSAAPRAGLVYSFPNLTGLVGITETAPDTFVVAGSNLANVSDIRSAVWEVRFDGDQATPRKIADLSGTGVLNGVAAVPGCGKSEPSAVLVADSIKGRVYRVDTKMNSWETAISVPEMAPVRTVGINGIKIREGYLYFDNSETTSFYKIKITSTGFAAEGASAELVAKVDGEPFLDDFSIGADGAIWAASNRGYTVRRINVSSGSSVVVAGSATSTTLLGDTATAFGRAESDQAILYVTTSGFNATNVPLEAGKIVAIDTSHFV